MTESQFGFFWYVMKYWYIYQITIIGGGGVFWRKKIPPAILDIFYMLISKIDTILSYLENSACYMGGKHFRFRTFSHVFCSFWKWCKFRNFEARNFYYPSNERSWAPLSKRYKFISGRIYIKKVTAHRKLQKVRKSQKCLDRNARQIEKQSLSPKTFYDFK